ncbi:MAG: exodeoxyribonuclease VII small subunit [Clostridia bacterium]|nr:exodeoxyribonuclease VII small subunit [Clostridia bacterium]
MNNKIEEMSFEAALARLESIVRMLESGNAALDESLSVFEEGIALVKMCNEKLEAAEQKIKILTKAEDGSLVETDFKPSDIKA